MSYQHQYIDGTPIHFPLGKLVCVGRNYAEHAKDLKHFINITGNGASFSPTANGFTIQGENIPTSARYYSMIDSLGSKEAVTDKYPFKTFSANVDLLNDTLNATFMMGASATVVATGRTYPDYTTY